MTFILPSFGASAIAAVPGGGGGGGFSNDYSLSFDGLDDYGNAGVVSALQNASAFSFSVWFKAGASGEYPAFGGYSSGTDQISAHGYSNDLWFNVRNGAETRYVVPSSNLPTDTTDFHHYVYTFDGGTFKVYVDGTERSGTKSNPGTTASGTANFNFNLGYQGFHYDQGLYDEFAIFSSALSASKITNIYRGETDGGSGGTDGVPGDISSFSPVAWWRMGDSETGVSNGSSTPTIVSNVASLQNNHALDFDGTDVYLSLGNISSLSSASAFTLSTWVKTSTNDKYIYSSYASGITDSIQMYFHSGGSLRCIVGSGSSYYQVGTSSTTLADGTWKNFSFVFSGGNYVKIYVDGSEETTSFVSGTNTVPTTTEANAGNTPRIAGYVAGGYSLNGLVDEVALFNSALSASDVTAIYNGGQPADIGSGGLNLNPTGWWRMGDGGTWNGSNWSIPDASVNSNTGTSANMVEGDRVTDTPTANAILKNGPTYSDNVPT